MNRGKVVAGGVGVLVLFIAVAWLVPRLFGSDEKAATLIAYAIGISGAIGLLVYALKARFDS